MSLRYEILSGQTVPENYSWDYGMPLTPGDPKLIQTAFSTKTYVSGYAPGLRVVFKNITNYPIDINGIFLWDFGDFYNDTNNVLATTGVSATVVHDYLMPGTYTITISSVETTTTLPNILVQVSEVPLVASMQSLTQPVTAYNKITVTLSPHTTVPGSYPIDQIDWNFGDKTPTYKVSRYTTPDPLKFVYTNKFPQDTNDPRNYAAVHTYVRDPYGYSMFYPSITAYAANTGSSDSCSLAIGPVLLRSLSSDETHIHKMHSDARGNLYAIQNNKNLGLLTTGSVNGYIQALPTPSKPNNPIRNSLGVPASIYLGNPGTRSYPPLYTSLDPFINNVSVLLHFEGLENSALITDSSNFLHTVNNPNSSVRISQEQKVFGVGSGNFNGSNSQISISNNTPFNFNSSEDFTIEGRIYFRSIKSGIAVASKGSLATSSGWTFYYFDGRLYFGIPYVSNDLSGPWIPQINRWYFMLAQRKNNILTLVVDNNIIASGSNNKTYTSTEPFQIGLSHSLEYLNGFVDEFRITKGIARYDVGVIPLSQILPPTEAYLDSRIQYF